VLNAAKRVRQFSAHKEAGFDRFEVECLCAGETPFSGGEPGKNIGAKKKALNHQLAKCLNLLVGRAGVEPTTNGLKVRCSTN
jgi:hypothetical protein